MNEYPPLPPTFPGTCLTLRSLIQSTLLELLPHRVEFHCFFFSATYVVSFLTASVLVCTNAARGLPGTSGTWPGVLLPTQPIGHGTGK